MKILLTLTFLLSFSPKLFAQETNIDSSRFYNSAIVQVLDKVAAKSSVLEIATGEALIFDSLKIIAHKCWQAPLDKKPESKILLEVFEAKSGSVKAGSEAEYIRIFYGWMFASSPSVSGLESSTYDLTALNCKNQ